MKKGPNKEALFTQTRCFLQESGEDSVYYPI